MAKFDVPHKAIHAVGAEAVDLVKKGGNQQARALIKETRSTVLAKLIDLFAEARRLEQETHREIAIVLTRGRLTFAATVDAIESVERLNQDVSELAEMGIQIDGTTIKGVGRRMKDDDLVFIMDLDPLAKP